MENCMFAQDKSKSDLDVAIEHALKDLNNHTSDSEEYGTVLDRVVRLKKLKDVDRQNSQISPDTLILAATNLLGIYMIIRHEHMNVITSKATGFVMKPR